MNADVEKWFSGLTEAQFTVANDLRALLLSRDPNLREELKWGQPCYSLRSMVCYIQKAKRHMSLGFAKGSEIADPNGRLQGAGDQMRHVKIPLDASADHVDLVAFVDEALSLDR